MPYTPFSSFPHISNKLKTLSVAPYGDNTASNYDAITQGQNDTQMVISSVFDDLPHNELKELVSAELFNNSQFLKSLLDTIKDELAHQAEHDQLPLDISQLCMATVLENGLARQSNNR